jgi:hypothetical protein
MARGVAGVAVKVGGTIGVSVGMGVAVAGGSPAPQAVRTAAITTKRMMNLGRTGFLQGRNGRIIHVDQYCPEGLHESTMLFQRNLRDVLP